MTTDFSSHIDSRYSGTTTEVLNMLQQQPEINVFGMERVKEALIAKGAQANFDSRVTHLRHLLSIYEENGPTSTIPNTTYIASDSVDHFFAGINIPQHALAFPRYRSSQI